MGIPILVAVRDSTEAVYVVLSAIVFINDFAILCFIFIPKIKHQKQGLPDGVSTAQSVLKSESQKAEKMHKVRATVRTSAGGLRGVRPSNFIASMPPLEDGPESIDEDA